MCVMISLRRENGLGRQVKAPFQQHGREAKEKLITTVITYSKKRTLSRRIDAIYFCCLFFHSFFFSLLPLGRFNSDQQVA